MLAGGIPVPVPDSYFGPYAGVANGGMVVSIVESGLAVGLYSGGFKSRRAGRSAAVFVSPEHMLDQIVVPQNAGVPFTRMSSGDVGLWQLMVSEKAWLRFLTQHAKAEEPKSAAPTSTFYEVLGVGRGADAGQIKRAYRSLAKSAHPDKGGDEDAFRLIAAAYAALSDPNQRQRYDAVLSWREKEEPFRGFEPRRLAQAIVAQEINGVLCESSGLPSIAAYRGEFRHGGGTWIECVRLDDVSPIEVAFLDGTRIKTLRSKWMTQYKKEDATIVIEWGKA